MDGQRVNWAGNYRYRAPHFFAPATVDEVCETVRRCEHIQALGAGHSFNGIADSTANQISLQHLNRIAINREKQTVTVGAGVTYGQLAPVLDEQGLALHNLASLPHISVVGACSTATHGSGLHNGNLSTAVCALEFVNAEGEQVMLTTGDGDALHGAAVGLGAMGVITSITLRLQPTYQVRQNVYENLSFDKLKMNLTEIFSAGYSVSLFTDWQNHCATQVWIKQSEAQAEDYGKTFLGATAATRPLHPLYGLNAENCTEQMGAPGPWYERLPHFRMNFKPSSGAELQTEYFVPFDRGCDAIFAVEGLRDRIAPLLLVTEFRAIAADDLWMSPCYQRASLALHFTWKPEWPKVEAVLTAMEEALAPFEPRPHWAKLFTMKPGCIQAQYPRLSHWKQLANRFDATGKFRNQFLNDVLYS